MLGRQLAGPEVHRSQPLRPLHHGDARTAEVCPEWDRHDQEAEDGEQNGEASESHRACPSLR